MSPRQSLGALWRVMGRRGRKVALVALAKKLLRVIWHLLVTGEEYVDRDYKA